MHRASALGRRVSKAQATFSLLPAMFVVVVTGCGQSAPPGKPELPQSVAPGWVRKSFDHAAPPPGLPDTSTPECWKAEYASRGAAEVWLCGYVTTGGSFDAMQRARAEADTVKFQEGRFLVLVKWSGGSKEEVTALVRAVQKSLAPK